MQLTFATLGLALATASALPLFPRQTTLSGKILTVLPLGDSITWGYADTSGNGYRSPLYNSLVSAGAKVDFVGSVRHGNMKDPDNEGHPGYTVSQIATSTSAIKNTVKPNVVLLHAGTNDANGSDDPSAAPGKLQNLIDQISSQWPNAAILVARIIPSTNANTQKNIDNINAQISTIVSTRANAGKHIAVVDMSKGKINTSDLSDALHPSVAGYAKMANLWLAGIQGLAAKQWV